MPASLPTHQKALLFDTQTNTLHLTTTAPVPSSPAEHVLAVHSTAITNGELTWAPFTHWPRLHTPCYDVSGTVLTTVPDSPFQIGDRVYGRIDAGREGTARQYAGILPSEAAKVPRGLSLGDAASVPMSAHTAWQALFEQGELCGGFEAGRVPHVDGGGETVGGQARGKRVLVLGAAGGVGIFAVQFARLAGAVVVGTAGERNKEFVEGLGADEVIDYTKGSVEEWVGGDAGRRFDLVLDCVGGKSMLDGWTAVKEDGGVYVSIVPGFREPDGGKPEGVKSVWFVMEARGSELAEIGKLIEKGEVKTWVDSVWRLDEFEAGFKKTASGHARGKVVLQVAEE